MHMSCWNEYYEHQKKQIQYRNQRRLYNRNDIEKSEYDCPLCRRLSNCIIPLVKPTEDVRQFDEHKPIEVAIAATVDDFLGQLDQLATHADTVTTDTTSGSTVWHDAVGASDASASTVEIEAENEAERNPFVPVQVQPWGAEAANDEPMLVGDRDEDGDDEDVQLLAGVQMDDIDVANVIDLYDVGMDVDDDDDDPANNVVVIGGVSVAASHSGSLGAHVCLQTDSEKWVGLAFARMEKVRCRLLLSTFSNVCSTFWLSRGWC